MSVSPDSQNCQEEWRDVVGFEGLYEVSSLGRVRSVPRYVHTTNKRKYLIKGKILRPVPQKSKHLQLWLRKEGQTIPVRVHRLVADAFLGPCPPNKECCHNNGVPFDNRVDNLRWDTRANNIRQSYTDGRDVVIPRHKKGSTHYASKLTAAQADFVRTSNLSGVELAKKLGVSPMTISRCKRGHTYTDVTP